MLTKVEPADFPEPRYRYMCAKGLCTPKLVYHPDRLKYPMKRVGERGEGKWQRISWDEALDTIAGKLKDIPAKYGRESVAVLTAGGPFPSQWRHFLRPEVGQRPSGVPSSVPLGVTNAGQGCADRPVFGDRRADHYLMDHENPRMFVYWGCNIVETAAWRYHRFREAREKGAKMVVISPIFTPTAAKADEWIPIRPGTDAALALGMINIIMSEGLCDEAFLLEYTVGPFLVRGDNGLFLRDSTGKYMVWDTKTNKPQTYDTPKVAPALRGSYKVEGIECKTAFQLLAELVEQYPVERASEITEVPPDAIRRLALDYATLKPVISDRGFGLQRGFHGDLAHRAISTLAAVTGNINLKIPE